MHRPLPGLPSGGFFVSGLVPRDGATKSARVKRADLTAQLVVAGWSSPVARQAHNLKVTGSNPVPATTKTRKSKDLTGFCR